jgi:uncharacterized protein (UPF0335 family)
MAVKEQYLKEAIERFKRMNEEAKALSKKIQKPEQLPKK